MENIFDEALEAYKRIKHNLNILYKPFIKENPKNLSNIKGMLRDFDALLQFSMMEIALNDGNLHKKELLFISSLPFDYNFLDYLRDKGYGQYTWDQLYRIDEKVLRKLLYKESDAIIKLNDTLIETIAIITTIVNDDEIYDGVTDGYVDLFDLLDKDIRKLIAAVAFADGEFDKEEILNGCAIIPVMKKFEERVKYYFSNKKPSNKTSNSSLKDFYVKKN